MPISGTSYYFDYESIIVNDIPQPGKWGRFSMTAAIPGHGTNFTVFSPKDQDSRSTLSPLFDCLPDSMHAIFGDDPLPFTFGKSDVLAADAAMDEQLALKLLSEGTTSLASFISQAERRIQSLRDAGFHKQADCQEARLKAVSEGIAVADILA